MALFRRKKPESEQANGDDQSGDKQKGNWRKPANTAFKQQRLKAWQPILTPKTVLPPLFLIGILFAPIGVLLIWGSGLVSQITIDYTNCDGQPQQTPPSDPSKLTFTPVSSYSYQLKAGGPTGPTDPPQWAFVNNSAVAAGNASIANICFLKFEIPADLQHSVFLYYKLTNFYQNHRRYVKSIDTDQLKGKAVSIKTLNKGDCSPLATIGDKIIYPCGLIANSIFNDTISNPVLLDPSGTSNTTYTMSSSGIAWPGEEKKYVVKPGYNVSQIVPPPNWMARYPNNYTEDNLPDLRHDQHFQNWMRTAGLPTFTKLYGRNDADTMKAGIYVIQINMNFPVKSYSGTKSIVISTVSWVGGKNPFLGWAYVGASGLLILLAFAGTARHCIKPRRLGDMTQLSWNQPGAR